MNFEHSCSLLHAESHSCAEFLEKTLKKVFQYPPTNPSLKFSIATLFREIKNIYHISSLIPLFTFTNTFFLFFCVVPYSCFSLYTCNMHNILLFERNNFFTLGHEEGYFFIRVSWNRTNKLKSHLFLCLVIFFFEVLLLILIKRFLSVFSCN